MLNDGGSSNKYIKLPVLDEKQSTDQLDGSQEALQVAMDNLLNVAGRFKFELDVRQQAMYR